jgi:glycosyltransferase involved in cell wall biosynthesis
MGFTSDVAAAMQKADVLILPSVEEGSALVTYEARACGCVLVVSDATGAPCEHMQNGLVHAAGDVAAVQEHISLLHRDRELLARLRKSSLASVGKLTWTEAAAKLVGIYRKATEN